MPRSTAFEGITVGHFETRRERELTAMFASRGARVVSCPLIFPETHGVEEPVRYFIEQAIAGNFSVVIFYTGIGILSIFDAARQLEKYEPLKQSLGRITTIARGPKGKGALKRHNLTPSLLAEPPTTDGLVKRLQAMDLRGKRVAVALAGDQPSSSLSQVVESAGGEIYQFAPYHYHLPDDLTAIEAFIRRVLATEIALMVFTTPPQVTILLDAAERLGLRVRLLESMRSVLTIAAIGTVTAATLDRYGVRAAVCPGEEDETMMGLVEAIERFVVTRRGDSTVEGER